MPLEYISWVHVARLLAGCSHKAGTISLGTRCVPQITHTHKCNQWKDKPQGWVVARRRIKEGFPKEWHWKCTRSLSESWQGGGHVHREGAGHPISSVPGSRSFKCPSQCLSKRTRKLQCSKWGTRAQIVSTVRSEQLHDIKEIRVKFTVSLTS